jgi:uncharacterized tellurite resistance protein B-like protein
VIIAALASNSKGGSKRGSRGTSGSNGSTVRVTVSASGSRRSREPTSRNLRSDFEKFWLPKNTPVTIQDFEIKDGFIYVGEDLAQADGYAVEPALINPKLKISRLSPDLVGRQMGYWSSYSEIPPRCRAAYLMWLANGRKDPKANIGYVFLYFYGLERRVLHDYKQRKKDSEEYGAIFRDIKRLIQIYGENASFAGYAQNLLFKMYLESKGRDLTATKPFISTQRRNLPPPIKVGLGQYSHQGRPIPADWALAWVLQDPEIRLRTPAKRCKKEFASLFKELYRARHGDGIVVKPNKTKLSESYRPASPGINRSISIYEVPALPDITILKRPRTMLAELADKATDKLDAYSRFIGREQSGRGSLEALALLPSELDRKVKHSGRERLREHLDTKLGDGRSAILPFEVIAEHYPFDHPEKVRKKEAVLLAQLLEKIGFGMEPDVRFAGIKPSAENDLVIFRQAADAPSAPSQAFEAAVLLMRLAAMVSAADGDVSPEEQEHMEQHLQTSLSLSDGERRRLHAHMKWLLAHEHQSFAGLKPKLEALAEPQRRSIGEFLITVAAADGQIDPGEVKILQKLYGRLGLDPDQVVSILHNFTSEPVTVKLGAPSSGFSVPPAPDQAQAGSSGAEPQSLDPAALQKKLSETARVAELLHGVFGDEEAESASEGSHRPQATDQQNVPGLDAEHSALLRAIGAKDSWERSELERIAEEHGLLLDGALEAINELAFDHADSPCIEEDGDIYLLERAAYEEIST